VKITRKTQVHNLQNQLRQEPNDHHSCFLHELSLEEEMKTKLLLSGALLVGLAAPAFADTTWYVVQGADHHCQVVDQRPVTKETTVVSPGGVTYKTRTEAMDAMKSVTVCR
jgi:hypothetical protein